MNWFDGVSLVWLGWAAVRGRKRGVAVETYRLVRAVLSLVAGCGLYRLVSHVLDALLARAGGVSGFVGFVLVFGGAFAAVRLLRKRITAWVSARVPERWQAWGGAAAGVLRGAVVLGVVVAAVGLAPLGPVRRAVAEQSAVGRVRAVLTPSATAGDSAGVRSGEKE